MGADEKPDLTVNLGPLRLANPVIIASGTGGYAREWSDFVDVGRLGAFITKSITPEPRKGNPPPRLVETRAGLINSIGLANMGLDAFCRDKLPELADFGAPVIVNVAGRTIDDYVAVADRLDGESAVSALEVNVSCPNVKEGGISFGTDPAQLRAVVSAVRAVVSQSLLIVKLTPNVTDIAAMAATAVDAGAEALSLINTFTAMAIDVEKRRPILPGGTGGLSGPAIRPIAVAMVHRVYTQVARPAGIPLIGMGGIQSPEDALQFILAGASAIAIGTALFIDPQTPLNIIDGLAPYLKRHNIPHLSDLIGTASKV